MRLFNFFTIYLGKYFGIPLYCHWSLTLPTAAFIIFGMINILFFWLALFFCVLLHEFGHAIVAQKLEIEVHKIVLYAFGGMAFVRAEEMQDPKDEFLITVAGPAANAILLLMGTAAYFLIPSLKIYSGIFMLLNVFMIVFNLLPILPLDGGRMFRAWSFYFLKDYQKSTWLTVRLSQLLTFVLVGLCCVIGQYILAVTFLFLPIWSEIEGQRVDLALKN
jgi:Zn-dependent protease